MKEGQRSSSDLLLLILKTLQPQGVEDMLDERQTMPTKNHLGADFLLKHPHDFVRPFLSDAARTIVSFPQSHTHLQQLNRCPLFLSTLSSARLITVNIEKRCPVKSVNWGRGSNSVFKQPQDRVVPLLSSFPATMVSLPHSHLQCHCTSLCPDGET